MAKSDAPVLMPVHSCAFNACEFMLLGIWSLSALKIYKWLMLVFLISPLPPLCIWRASPRWLCLNRSLGYVTVINRKEARSLLAF